MDLGRLEHLSPFSPPFLATATTLAQAKREESRHILKILERLQAAEGKPLLELLGKHRAQVGDLIIFWEVPDGWTILSRDRTFEILKNKYRAGIDFYMVRLPRYASGHRCMIRRDGIAEDVGGVLMNYNARGARVQAPIIVSERQRITIEAQEIASRVGEVSKFKNEAERTSQPSFGLKFKSSQHEA